MFHGMIKRRNRSSGFTLVELLIVIVVIAILATISIVAYNGIQNRAKATAGQQLASQIVKKLEAYNAIHGTYPTTRAQLQGTPESKVDGFPSTNADAATKPVRLPAADTLFWGTPAGASPTTRTPLDAAGAENGQAVTIWGNADGGNVYWWDYTKSSGQETPMKYGL